MLGKLLKYEIPAMGRKLLPLYVAWAATALFLGLTTQAAESKNEFMVVISALLYTAIATAIFVMTVIMIVQRYKNSLLGDEAYFNHVLPVTVSEHIGNKAISATLWVFVTILVAVFTGLLIGIGAYILIMIFESSVGRALMPLIFNLEYSADGFVNFNRVFIPGFILTVIFSVIYFFICKYLMENKLNLA